MPRIGFAILGLLAALLAGRPAIAQLDVPTGKGLPVQVNVAVEYVDVVSYKENNNAYTAVVDIRLRWQDLRLQRPDAARTEPPRVFRGPDADAQMAKMWMPAVELANQRSRPTYTTSALWIEPDGRVELIKRVSSDFASNTNVFRFPFDRQNLKLNIVARDDEGTVELGFVQDDLDYSRHSKTASLDGWDLGVVTLRNEPVAGWRGATYGQVVASLEIARQSGIIVGAVLLPLFASLLIPMLAIWLNRNDDGYFHIETFELVNIIIGGLFAVIALNFTVNSAYEMLSSGDNPVHRLLALNYLALGASLLVNVLLFRFGVVASLCGRYVQEQVYFVLAWAIPVIAFGTATAIVLTALA
jgi:hypothetical protein